MNVLDRWRSFPNAVSCMRGSASGGGRRGRGRSLPRSRLRHLVSLLLSFPIMVWPQRPPLPFSPLVESFPTVDSRTAEKVERMADGIWGAQPTTCHCHCQGALYMGSNKMEQSYWPRGVNRTPGLSFRVQDHEKAKVRCLPVNDREDF
jgi:hypothetical protein